jgi:hypothetical protein
MANTLTGSKQIKQLSSSDIVVIIFYEKKKKVMEERKINYCLRKMLLL